jgi:hypothetical protein
MFGFTSPNDEIFAEGSIDPMGLRVIWTDLADEIFGGRINTIFKDTLATINEMYGKELTEEDRIGIKRVMEKVYESEELAKTFRSNNSESNKKHKLGEVLEGALFELIDERVDFYNKMSDERMKGLLVDHLFQDYRAQMKES